jgi:hypothetical protein
MLFDEPIKEAFVRAGGTGTGNPGPKLLAETLLYMDPRPCDTVYHTVYRLYSEFSVRTAHATSDAGVGGRQ